MDRNDWSESVCLPFIANSCLTRTTTFACSLSNFFVFLLRHMCWSLWSEICRVSVPSWIANCLILKNSNQPTILSIDHSFDVFECFGYKELLELLSAHDSRGIRLKSLFTWSKSASMCSMLIISRYSTEGFVYWVGSRPDGFEALKFGWIQVLAIFYPFFKLVRYWEQILFEYNILETRVVSDFQPKMHRFWL